MKIGKYLNALLSVDISSIMLALSRPGLLRPYLRACRHAYLELRSKNIQTHALHELFPDIFDVASISMCVYKKTGEMSIEEVYILAVLARLLQPETVFEIGTFEGVSLSHIILNLNNPKNHSLYTLDLPQETVSDEVGLKKGFLPSDKDLIATRRVGHYYKKLGLEEYVQQKWGDSAKFDFSPYYGKVDFIIVDGAHSREYIKNDTEQALKMIRPGGIVIWHDYGGIGEFDDLRRYMDSISSDLELIRIKGTSFLIHKA